MTGGLASFTFRGFSEFGDEKHLPLTSFVSTFSWLEMSLKGLLAPSHIILSIYQSTSLKLQSYNMLNPAKSQLFGA